MKLPIHATIIGVLTAIALVGLIVLAGLGKTQPQILETVALVGVSAMAGLAIPTSTVTAAPVVVSAPAAPVEPDAIPDPPAAVTADPHPGMTAAEELAGRS